jgi:hypothetical protein
MEGPLAPPLFSAMSNIIGNLILVPRATPFIASGLSPTLSTMRLNVGAPSLAVVTLFAINAAAKYGPTRSVCVADLIFLLLAIFFFH